MQQHFLFFLVVKFTIILYFVKSNNLKKDDIQKTINQIYYNLQKEQAQSNIPFRKFPPRWEEEKGLYRSFIHVNWVDKSNSIISTFMRNNIKVLDSNNFVTSFCLMNLLEAYELSAIKIDGNSFKNGLDALLEYRDKNYGFKTPIYTFWKQIFLKEKNVWSQNPGNMNRVVNSLPDFPDVILKTLRFFKLNGLADFFQTYNGLRQGFLYAYRIPSDMDDTSVNLALTGRLNNFPELKNYTSNWTNSNTNFSEMFLIFKRYAYRPFLNQSNNTNASSTADIIDTRSYFVLHNFITEKAENASKLNKTPSLILPATWLLDIEKHKNLTPDVGMPFSVNNVDHNVAINFLFGITNFILFHKNQTELNILFDQEMQQMYSDTIDLVIHSIKKNTVNKRPDLTLVYYPSVYDFYWLVTRVYSLINNNIDNINISKSEFLIEIKNKLESLLQNEATLQLSTKVINFDNEQNYFEEFLGNAGNYTRGEDRLFSTGLALNSLLNIWTYANKSTNSFHYLSNTPDHVRQIIGKSVNYITRNINKYFISLENSFFSGSIKTGDTFPYFYPGNYYKYLNGTDVPDINNTNYITPDLIPGTKVMSPEEFETNLNKTFFGRKPPQEFLGFNTGPFPYWSSPAMTLSVNLLGLSKYKNLN